MRYLILLLTLLTNASATLYTTTATNLQSTLDTANGGNPVVAGDIIEVTAGTNCAGCNILLFPNPGPAPITIRTSAWRNLPFEGNRITPSYASSMAKITTNSSSPALSTENTLNWSVTNGSSTVTANGCCVVGPPSGRKLGTGSVVTWDDANGGLPPTPFDPSVAYYVTPLGVNTFTLSTTPTGSAITATQTCSVSLACSSNAIDLVIANINNWVIRGLEFTTSFNSTNNFTFDLIKIGNLTAVQSVLPNNIVISQNYIHGTFPDGTNLSNNTKVGLKLNAQAAQVTDNWIDNMHNNGGDSQALTILNATGPIIIQNNRLDGSTENSLIGGGAAPILGGNDVPLQPNGWLGGIQFIGNDYYKSWTQMLFNLNCPNGPGQGGCGAGNPTNPCTLWDDAYHNSSLTGEIFTNNNNNPISITNATNAAPIVITTSGAHGFSNGDIVSVAGVGGNTAANSGAWVIGGVTGTTFQLVGSTGNGTYTAATGTTAKNTYFQCTNGSWSAAFAAGVLPWHYSIKNVFELKNAANVLVSGNIIQNNWAQGQDGRIVLYNQVDNFNINSTIQNVLFTNNSVHTAVAAFTANGAGVGGFVYLTNTNRIQFINNQWYDMGNNTRLGSIGGIPETSPANILYYTELHNTIANTTAQAAILLNSDTTTPTCPGGTPPNLQCSAGTRNENNIYLSGDYGIHPSSGADTCTGLRAMNPNIQFLNPIVVGTPSWGQFGTSKAACSTNPLLPANEAAMNYNNLAGNDFTLTNTSPGYQAAADGTDVGANIPTINMSIGGVSGGTASPDVLSKLTPQVGSTSLAFTFVPGPGQTTATIKLSTNPNLSSATTITGASPAVFTTTANTQYYYIMTSGTWTVVGQVKTLPSGSGSSPITFNFASSRLWGYQIGSGGGVCSGPTTQTNSGQTILVSSGSVLYGCSGGANDSLGKPTAYPIP